MIKNRARQGSIWACILSPPLSITPVAIIGLIRLMNAVISVVTLGEVQGLGKSCADVH